jgi:hypothetical protein
MLDRILNGNAVNLNHNVVFETDSVIKLSAGVLAAGVLIIIFNRLLTKWI